MDINAVQVMIALIGTGGFAGAIAAFLRVRPERQTAAITQVQGAMEAMAQLNDALKEELDRQKDANNELERICSERAKKLEEATKMIHQLQQLIHGVVIMEDDITFPPKEINERHN